MKKLMIAAGLFTVMSLPLSTVALAAPDTMTVETGIGPVLGRPLLPKPVQLRMATSA